MVKDYNCTATKKPWCLLQEVRSTPDDFCPTCSAPVWKIIELFQVLEVDLAIVEAGLKGPLEMLC